MRACFISFPKCPLNDINSRSTWAKTNTTGQADLMLKQIPPLAATDSSWGRYKSYGVNGWLLGIHICSWASSFFSFQHQEATWSLRGSLTWSPFFSARRTLRVTESQSLEAQATAQQALLRALILSRWRGHSFQNKSAIEVTDSFVKKGENGHFKQCSWSLTGHSWRYLTNHADGPMRYHYSGLEQLWVTSLITRDTGNGHRLAYVRHTLNCCRTISPPLCLLMLLLLQELLLLLFGLLCPN